MIKIFIVDDHDMLRNGIRSILLTDLTINIVKEAKTGVEVLNNLNNIDWDIMLLDISMPDITGIDILKQIKLLLPNHKVIVFSMYASNKYSKYITNLGAYCYISKSDIELDLIGSIKNAYNNKIKVQYYNFNSKLLSAREYQICKLLLQGARLKDISKELKLNIKTVATYKYRMFKKLGLSNDIEFMKYVQENLIF